MTAVSVTLVSDSSDSGHRLHQVLSTVDDLAVDCVLAFGPGLPEALSRRDGKLVVVYTPGQAETGLRLLDAVRDCDRAANGVRIVLVGESDEPGIAAEALRRGAFGYLVYSLPAAQLRGALAMLAQLVAQPASSRIVVLPQPAHVPRARAAELLSERELEVIGLIAQAYTNGQIGRRLGIAEGTVKRHVNSIFIKLGAVSRLDAVNKYAKWRTERPVRERDQDEEPGAAPRDGGTRSAPALCTATAPRHRGPGRPHPRGLAVSRLAGRAAGFAPSRGSGMRAAPARFVVFVRAG
jgi:DNA-binding NarL/FixJ family response regulator